MPLKKLAEILSKHFSCSVPVCFIPGLLFSISSAFFSFKILLYNVWITSTIFHPRRSIVQLSSFVHEGLPSVPAPVRHSLATATCRQFFCTCVHHVPLHSAEVLFSLLCRTKKSLTVVWTKKWSLHEHSQKPCCVLGNISNPNFLLIHYLWFYFSSIL